MEYETAILIADTILLWGLVAGYWFSYFLDKLLIKIKQKKVLEQEFKDAWLREQSRKNIEVPEVVEYKKPIHKQIDNDICVCGHNKKNHILNKNKKLSCYFLLNKSDEDELICECENYNPKLNRR